VEKDEVVKGLDKNKIISPQITEILNNCVALIFPPL